MSRPKVRLFVATPMYGGQCFGPFMQAMLGLQAVCAQNNIGFHFQNVINESLIPRARNLLTREFLESDATHLMFIDADILFNPPDVLTLIKADKELIGGAYSGKTINWENVRNAALAGVPPEQLAHFGTFPVMRMKDGHTFNQSTKQPVEMKSIATGFMLIKRCVFENLADKVPTYTDGAAGQDKAPTKVFFDTSMRGNEYCSEDYHFCYLHTDNGGKVYLAPWIVLHHLGTYMYMGGFNFAPKPFGGN